MFSRKTFLSFFFFFPKMIYLNNLELNENKRISKTIKILTSISKLFWNIINSSSDHTSMRAHREREREREVYNSLHKVYATSRVKGGGGIKRKNITLCTQNTSRMTHVLVFKSSSILEIPSLEVSHKKTFQKPSEAPDMALVFEGPSMAQHCCE
jgi:hypothetical protein